MATNEAQWPALWRWSGTNFQKIDRLEATSIMRSFSLNQEDLLVREGWKEKHLSFTEGETSLPIRLNSQQFDLVLREKAVQGEVMNTVLLKGRTNASSEEIVAQSGNNYKMVKRSRYYEVFR